MVCRKLKTVDWEFDGRKQIRIDEEQKKIDNSVFSLLSAVFCSPVHHGFNARNEQNY